MPSRDIDYSKTVIYRIVCNDLSITYTYVGYTTDLTKRKYQHKTGCNNPNDDNKYNLKLYTTIRENGGWDAWSVVLVENYPCDNGTDARQRERYWFEFYGAGLNVYRPFVTDEEAAEKNKERTKKYYVDNKDKIKESTKQYRDNNVDKIKESTKQYYVDNKEIKKEYYVDNKDKLNEKYNCECGGKYTTQYKSRHFKTKKHKKFIETNVATL